ncbi:hypothetical protein MUG84_13250 [Paenibacillus sp. KQZ6P-2]|uniref:Uncharacterized protein n=1 Tax=Paenibacillus mangrovi TaxID=2931978 RepID=A0A9X1WPJ0_9BACL|nr:hypothetical protein [Paenibacillus mangrovi]MCJ8012698.1 hypothetical protein [Paenibacillus mangrovi]
MNSVNRNPVSYPEMIESKPSLLRWLRRWPEWIRYATIIWTLAYGAMGLFWALGGAGFPLGMEGEPNSSHSVFSYATAMAGGTVMAILCLLGVILLFMYKAKAHGFARSIPILYAWSAAAVLCFAVPDARVLIAVASAPVSLIMALIGSPIPYSDVITWPVVNQIICLGGGFLWGATALVFQRQSGNACAYCGRKSGASPRTSSDSAARWGKWATWIAILAPVYYDITRIAWLLGIPLGITEEMFRSLQDTGAASAGAGLALVSIGGAVLTRGLIEPWGETFPRWIPFLAGKRVPPTLAIVPAALVSVMLTITGIQTVRDSFVISLFPNWGATTPLLLMPIWGIALGAAAIAYYYRRRGRCSQCG